MSRLNRRLPPLNALVAFEAAYRLHSFTRAADELALSQASVSRRVRELETNLGLCLFERRRYDVVPTTDGDTLGTTVRLALNELADAAETLRLRGGQSGLTIFSDLGLSNALVAPLLGAFQRQHPELLVRVLSSYEPIEALHEPFDIGLNYGRAGEDRFSIEALADETIFPVCSAAFAARLPARVDAVELAKQPLLHLSVSGRQWPDWRSFLALFRVKQPPPLDGLVFSSYQVCLDVAEQGEGIALGWARTVQARLDSGRLVRLHGLTMPLPNSIHVYRPKHARPSNASEQFLQLLRNSITPVG